jgi:hypothetical protein
MTNLLTVERFMFKPDWTISRLYLSGAQFCYVIEDEIRGEKVHGETAIPYGIYDLGARVSPKFSSTYYWNDSKQRLITAKEHRSGLFGSGYKPHELLWVLNVPNFEFILLHWGNTDDDTEGCLIVGNSIGMVGKQEGVLNSRITYQELYPKIYPLVKSGGQKIEIIKSV